MSFKIFSFESEPVTRKSTDSISIDISKTSNIPTPDSNSPSSLKFPSNTLLQQSFKSFNSSNSQKSLSNGFRSSSSSQANCTIPGPKPFKLNKSVNSYTSSQRSNGSYMAKDSQRSQGSYISDGLRSYISRVSYLNSDIYQEQESDLQELWKLTNEASPINSTLNELYTATDDDELYISDDDLVLSDTLSFAGQSSKDDESTEQYMLNQNQTIKEIYSLIYQKKILADSKDNLHVICEICKSSDYLITLPIRAFGIRSRSNSETESEFIESEFSKVGNQIVASSSYSICPCSHVFHNKCLYTWQQKFTYCPTCDCSIKSLKD